MSDMMLFSGNANHKLAENISAVMSLPLGKANIGRFSDGEVMVEILENVRGRDIFIIQPTCAPTNENLMELLVLTDALRRASASRITAVMPYFGYARQDRRPRSARVPITAKIVADMLMTVGIDRLVTVDLHADQIQGFFHIPVDNVYGTPVFIDDLKRQDVSNLMIISPDIGGVVRARAAAKRLNDRDMAIIDKRRIGPNRIEVMHLIGDVKDKDCLLVDDIVDTGGTLCHAAQVLKENGARSVFAHCTHPVFSGLAVENIKNSAIDEIVVTDSIPLSAIASKCSKIRQLSLGPLLAETIQRIYDEESVSSLFVDN